MQILKNACKAQADLAAMQNNAKITNIAGLSANTDGGVVVARLENEVVPQPTDIYASNDYRMAFMANVVHGTAIPGKFQNANANTKTTDVGSVIPTTVLEKIIEKLESTGMILPLITRTNYKGGVSIPVSAVKPVATWVSEGAGSDKQKKTTDKIVFSYYKLRCAISVSLEVDTVSLPIFEATFVSNVVEAMTKTAEQAVISGDGTGNKGNTCRNCCCRSER